MNNHKCRICHEEADYDIETPNYIFDFCVEHAIEIEEYIKEKANSLNTSKEKQ
jgi:hypothetical protein